MSEIVYVVLRVHERVLMAGRSIVVSGGGGMVVFCRFLGNRVSGLWCALLWL